LISSCLVGWWAALGQQTIDSQTRLSDSEHRRVPLARPAPGSEAPLARAAGIPCRPPAAGARRRASPRSPQRFVSRWDMRQTWKCGRAPGRRLGLRPRRAGAAARARRLPSRAFVGCRPRAGRGTYASPSRAPRASATCGRVASADSRAGSAPARAPRSGQLARPRQRARAAHVSSRRCPRRQSAPAWPRAAS